MKTLIFTIATCVLLVCLLLQRPAQPASTNQQLASQLESIQFNLAHLIAEAATAAEMREHISRLTIVLDDLADNQLDLVNHQLDLATAITSLTSLRQIDLPKVSKDASAVRLVSAISETKTAQSKVKDALDEYGADPALVARVAALEADLAALRQECLRCNCIAGANVSAKVTNSGGSNGSVTYSPYTTMTTTTPTYSTTSGGSNGSVTYSPYVQSAQTVQSAPYVQSVQTMASVPQDVRIVQPRTVTRATVNQPVPVTDQFYSYAPDMDDATCVQQADGSVVCSGNTSRGVPTVQTQSQSRPRLLSRLFGR